MATVKKRLLSSSTNGKSILVANTATLGNLIHTAVAGTVAGTYDEVWLWAQNNHSGDVEVTIEFGDVAAKDNIIVTVPYRSGLVPVVPGFCLNNGATVTAFAAIADVVTIHGFVNAITD